jgi:hypothetical protein
MYAVRLSDIGDTGDAVPAGVGGDAVAETPKVSEVTKMIEITRVAGLRRRRR